MVQVAKLRFTSTDSIPGPGTKTVWSNCNLFLSGGYVGSLLIDYAGRNSAPGGTIFENSASEIYASSSGVGFGEVLESPTGVGSTIDTDLMQFDADSIFGTLTTAILVQALNASDVVVGSAYVTDGTNFLYLAEPVTPSEFWTEFVGAREVA